MKMNYQVIHELSQRGPIESAEPMGIDGTLLVGDRPVAVWNGPGSSCGSDHIRIYPAVHNGCHAWLEYRCWSPAFGYSASGTVERILSMHEGLELMIARGQFEHLFPESESETQ